MGRFFGTDGIRGRANQFPITPEMALRAGRALSLFVKDGADSSGIIIGKDTRISGYMIEYAMVSGICSSGVNVYLSGIMPTPGVAYLTSATRAMAGVMLSASHNPFYDNGIKIFNKDGFKLSDDTENELERLMSNEHTPDRCREIQTPGQVYDMQDARHRYEDFLAGKWPDTNSLNGFKVVLDCSNGATYQVAPSLFNRLGADVEALFIDPDGKNINEGCGSQHTGALVSRVLETGADLGLAFDGDGDRLIAVDEHGNILTGDQIIAICAKSMKRNGLLSKNTVVTTVMSNVGLKLALREMGIDYRVTPVGDRYVLQEMQRCGAVIGGEDSGHMIFLNDHTTGDGILTALKLLQAILDEGVPLSKMAKWVIPFPQVLMNVEVADKPEISTIPQIVKAIQAVEGRLKGEGRVLVRYSGTQPLCRVMVEGPGDDETLKYCEEIVSAVRETIGKAPIRDFQRFSASSEID